MLLEASEVPVKDLELEGLRCLVALARHVAVARAAETLAIEETDLRLAIGRLERALGRELVKIEDGRAALTPDGARLSPQAQRCVEQARRCVSLFGDDEAPASGFELIIGTRFELGLSWLVPALDELSENDPDRTLGLSFADGPELLRRLRLGEIDAMISSMRLDSGGLESAQLHLERYAFVGTPQVVKEFPVRDAKDAAQHVLLDINADLPLFRYFSAAQSDQQEWSFAHYEHLGTIAAIRARMLAEVGIGVLPVYYIRDDINAGTLVPVMSQRRLGTDTFSLSWRTGHPRANALAALAAELKTHPLR